MTFRIGIIGCGGIAGMHMRGYRECPDVKVIACADISAERAAKFATDNEIEKHYSDFRQMLETEKLDAVSVCTPNYAHFEPTVIALQNDINVLCEKPIAMNAAEAALMVEAARASRAMLTIGHHMRFLPYAQFLKKMIDAGDLGHIYFGRSQALRRRGIPGWGEFHIKAKSGGGPLIDIGVHVLDLITWFMGSPVPARVSGSVYTVFGDKEHYFNPNGNYKRQDYDVEDFGCGFVKFHNGATLLLEASWAAHVPDVETWPQMVLGDKGGATVIPSGSPQLRIFTSREQALLDVTPSAFVEVQPHIEEVKYWAACLRGEKEVLVKPEESLNVQRIIDAIYASSEQGHEILFPDDSKEADKIQADEAEAARA